MIRPDPLLGPPWTAETIPLTPTAEHAAPVATLVHRPPPADPRGAMLYVHGYNDHFFHEHLAEWAEAAGWAVYALDLRGCGRSLQPGDIPHHITDVDAYAEELDAAVARIRVRDGHDTVWLNAHSTGGLVGVRHAQQRRDHAPYDALVLDAPFLAMPPTPAESVLLPLVDRLGARLPRLRLGRPGLAPYSLSLHAPTDDWPMAKGEWVFDTTLKRMQGARYTVGWLRAVQRAQAAVAAQAALDVPTLVLTSARSWFSARYSPAFQDADTVLDVDRIHQAARAVSHHREHLRLEGAMHDVWLSREPVRTEAWHRTRAWLDRVLGG